MDRHDARSKRGKRVNIRISGKRYTRIGLVAAQCKGDLLAPYTYNETMKAYVFVKWFEDDLLKNASFYKKEVVQNPAEKYLQTLIFLPLYSPEYNPIEHTWSVLKRKIADCVQRYGSISQALAAVLESNEL